MISISKVLLDDDLSLCSPLARVLFIGLLYKYNCDEINVNSFRRIKAEILPYDDCDMFLLFGELAKNGLLEEFSQAAKVLFTEEVEEVLKKKEQNELAQIAVSLE